MTALNSSTLFEDLRLATHEENPVCALGIQPEVELSDNFYILYKITAETSNSLFYFSHIINIYRVYWTACLSL